jgi:hypothetical protein
VRFRLHSPTLERWNHRPEVLGKVETIGVAHERRHGCMYYTELGESVAGDLLRSQNSRKFSLVTEVGVKPLPSGMVI